MRTNGISPKAKLAAAVVATLGTAGSFLIVWLVTGHIDRAAIAGPATGVLGAWLAFVGAWLGSPGDVQPPEIAFDQAAAGPAVPPEHAPSAELVQAAPPG